MSQQEHHAVTDYEGHDRIFVTTFLGVLAILVAITVVIAIIANMVDADDGSLAPVQLEQTTQRLKPVGEVYTDASQVKVATAPAAASEPRSAATLLDTVCGACHSGGLAGAPKYSDSADWKSRREAAGGLAGLVKSVVQGKGAMPPKGGDPSLDQTQLQQAVELLLERAGL